MVFRTWAHNVREQVRQAQRDWVTDMIEERLPQMIQDTLQRDVMMKLESQQLEANDVTARIMSSTAALQREVDRLRREVDTAQARKMRESEHIANKILRQWKLQFVTKAFGAWQEGLPWMTATFVPGPYIAILLLEASVRSEAAIHGKRPVVRRSSAEERRPSTSAD